MNKQQVLERLLERVRRYEEQVSEEPLVTPLEAATRLRVLCATASTRPVPTLPGNTELLEQMGALVIHLLRTKYEPASTRSLEEWLEAKA